MTAAITAAVRAYIPQARESWHGDRDWRPARAIVFDTETSPELDQALRFLSYRLVAIDWSTGAPVLDCIDEGFAYADDLPEGDPAGLAILQAYCRTRPPEIAAHAFDAGYRLRCLTRTEFLREVLRPTAMEPDRLDAWVVAYNLPFDLTRLGAPHLPVSVTGWQATSGYAKDAESGKRVKRDRPSPFAGGFSIPLGEYQKDGRWRQEAAFRPRLGIKHLGPRKNRIGWIWRRKSEGAQGTRGHFLDLLTLAAAMTGESHNLSGACAAFGVSYEAELARFGVSFSKADAPHGGPITDEYVAYNRADTAATSKLLGAVLAEYAALGIRTDPAWVLSTASIAKDTLDRLGMKPLLERQPAFPPNVMGAAMSAFHGGRVECHIRRTSVPVTYLDFRALYPTVSILLDLQAFLTCARVGVREVGATAVEAWLTRCDLRSALQPKTWARLGGIALVQPAGDILPVSADWRHDGSNGIALNIVERATEPLWYALPDLLASRLLTGHAPKVLRVLRFVPKGLQDGLKTVHLGGRVRVDPLGGNLYRALIEGRASVESGDDLLPDERRRLDRFLKNVANSLYGITAEVDPDDAVPAGAEVTAYGLRTFRTSLTRPEKPGRFFFAPQAALTTAGGRLMMAILERLVSDRGGTWATADTDSMSIVSSPEGGPVSCRTPDRTDSIRALSWIEVEAVRETLNTLNPYDRSKVPHLLKLEDVNFEGKDPLLPRQALSAYAVASKKYALSAGAAAGAEIVWPATTGLDSATDEAEIVDRREHGLGHVRDPLGNHNVAQKPDWITQAWAWTLAHEAGQRLTTPDWFGLPLITANATVTTPAVARALNARRRTYRDAIKPFNFLDRPIVDQHELSDAMRGLHLLAPFVADPARWLTRTYVDPGCPGQRFPITVEPTDPEVGADGSGAVKVRTYGELVSDLPTHVEAASDGPDGRPCGPATVGLLSRRRVAIVDVRHRLRETRLIPEPGDATHGTVAQVTFLDEPERHEWARQVLPIIRSFPRARVLAHTEISATTLARIIRSGQAGDARYVEALSAAAARLAGEQLPAWGIKAPAERRARLVTFLAELAMRNPASFAEAHGAPRTCRLCGRELSGRQRGLCVACSKLPGRSRRAAPAAEPQAVK